MITGCGKLPYAETYGVYAHSAAQAILGPNSQEVGLWIVTGSTPLPRKELQQRMLNTSLPHIPQGGCVTRYDKIHLFQFDIGHAIKNQCYILASAQGGHHAHGKTT